MTQVLDFSRLVDRTLNALADVLGSDGAALMLIDDHDRLRAIGGSDDRGLRLEMIQERIGAGPAIETLHRGEDVAVDDLRAARPHGFPGVAEQVSEVRAVLSVPLRAEERLIGTLNFYDRTSHEWQPAKVRTGERLGELMVMVLQTMAHRSLLSGKP
ncbi:GAF domain-containing protein [Streptosporangium sp. NPDC048865]|uniref:GAF domain-containing protein n=1 Tax=Streptosporangium sp. NPDC048865 TaxID=3155766 RepID=UPI003445F9C7